MLALTAINETLEITTSSTSLLHFYTGFIDHTTSGGTIGKNAGTIAVAGANNIIVPAPAASTQRQIKKITLENKGTVANIITVQIDINGTVIDIITFALQPGENLVYNEGEGFGKHASNGETMTQESTYKSAPLNSQSFHFLKVGLANEAAGILHSQHAATGNPGAWLPGTPGVNGRATDGTTAADAGCIPIKNPVSGSNYLTDFFAVSTVAAAQFLADFLWINTGLAVTTLTAQTITPVALPARDGEGSTAWTSVQAGILVTTATTNAAVIANITMSYTDSDGNAGNTATISSFPATAVAGTLVPFQLASGDKGVRSVQSVTFGTSLGGGAVSLVLYRMVAGVPQIVANVGSTRTPDTKRVKLYNGSCLIPVTLSTSTAAQTINGVITIETM